MMEYSWYLRCDKGDPFFHHVPRVTEKLKMAPQWAFEFQNLHQKEVDYDKRKVINNGRERDRDGWD
jgi:hypothetical protein